MSNNMNSSMVSNQDKSSPIFHLFMHLIIGILFGAGLAISEMANPNAVLSFLDVSAIFTQDSPFSKNASWNPDLIFVMVSAILVGVLAYAIKNKMTHPKFTSIWRLPSKLTLDKPLIFGAIFFGIGWGLAGYCPGPALTALVNNPMEGVYFLSSMLVGSFAFQAVSTMRKT